MMKRCYDAEMRTTISIDDELLNIARSMAEQKNASIGTVVSDLIRSGLHRRTEYKIDDGDRKPELEILKVDRAIRKHFNLPYRGGHMIQPWFREKIRGSKKPEIKGKVTLTFTFFIEDIPANDLELCMEEPQNFNVKINGEEVCYPDNPDTWIDICLKKTNLPVKLLNKGKKVESL